jgi:YVTN family beta-propeller protein
MEFRILGPLEVEEAGRRLPLGGGKQRALLAILLVHANEVVSRDRLIEELWGGSPPQTATTALQVHVSQLRKLLDPGATRGEEELLVTRAPGYVLRVERDRIDLGRFEALVAAGKAALAKGDAQRAREQLVEALALWRGRPLGDLETAPFAQAESLRLEELRLGALEERIEADLALGRHADLVPELEGLVSQEPLRERLRWQLMLALYRCGRQADALDVYRKGRRVLDEELGLEPGEALQRLERAILNQDSELAAPPPSPGAAPDKAVPTGTVTFLFTDIESSTRLVQQLGDPYGELLEEHRRVLRSAFGRFGGQEIDSQGDAFFFAFRRARDAVAAAVEAQRAIAAEGWPGGATVRIRIGIHTGEPGLAGAGYHGIDVVRAARISGAASGGQILVSSATRDLVGDGTVADVSFRDLGEHRLKDIDRPQRVFQVVIPGLADDFPPLRVVEPAQVLPVGGREDELAAAAEAAVGNEERRIRLSRRGRLLAVLGAVVLAGAAAAAAIELAGGSGEKAVVASANSLGVIDPKENRIVGAVPVGSSPSSVAIDEGAVWVANSGDGTVSRIDPKTRKVVKTIGVGAPVIDVAAGHGAVWTANGSDGSVSEIDPKTNAVVRSIDLRGPDELTPDETHAIAIGVGALWVATGSRHIVRIDPDSGRVVATIDVGSQPADVDVTDDAVWTATSGERVVRIEPRTNAAVAEAAVSFPVSVAAGPDAVWVGTYPDSVWRIDPATTTVAGTVATEGGADGVAIGLGSLWIADGRWVLRVDPRTNAVTNRIRVGALAVDVAADENAVYVVVAPAT